MPIIKVNTNVPSNRVDNSDVLKTLSTTLAGSVGKPEQWIMVQVLTDQVMCFAGTEEPCATAEITSIGAIGGNKNKQITKAVCDVLKAKLGVPPNRVYVKFNDVQASDIGWDSSTFA